jgi:hypothetical protein
MLARGSLLLIMLLLVGPAWPQEGRNPFDLVPPEQQPPPVTDEAATAAPVNPFDLQTGASESPAAPATPPEATPVPVPAGEAEIPAGGLLALTLALLVLTVVALLFFRSLYLKSYRAVLNDNMLSQLYREREAGAFGRFLVGYGLFFFAGGFFIYLAGVEWGYFSPDRILQQVGLYSLGLLLLFLGKHLLLALLGWIFPFRSEVKRYSFTIMVFSYVLGVILSPACFLISYAPENWARPLIYLVLGLLVLVYVLRSLRGLFIANRYVFNHQFHFLLYICAVEIVPALTLYKVLTEGLV